MWEWFVNLFAQILEFIQGIVGDWGLAIIIFVVIIRLILTPLLMKSTKSNARMQVLQPKLQEIQERYADDPNKQAEEMQKFYAENSFNPLSGCLPMLIQFPILIALFQVLRDLADYFPGEDLRFYNILPDLSVSVSDMVSEGFLAALPYVVALGLFGVLSLIPSLLSANNQTGEQAATTRWTALIMAVLMIFIGWNLPAGVLLYYDVSSGWQVVQQIFITQRVTDQAKAEEEERMANAPVQINVERRQRKPRQHKKK